MVQHGEIKAVSVGNITQLAAGRITHSRPLDLDHVCPEPGEQLGTGWARLNVGHIKDPHTFKRFHKQGLRFVSNDEFDALYCYER